MDDLESVDISAYPEILELVEAVRLTDEPRVLSIGGEDVAVLAPLGKRKRRRSRERTKEDLEAFRSSAGAWEGIVDTDKLQEHIAEGRRRPSRPRVDL